MRAVTVGLLAMTAALALAGCQKKADGFSTILGQHRDGRYVGIGLYPAGTMWEQVAQEGAKAEGPAARLKDDDQIIVVIDSVTGEVRQCGNLSGYCVAMNPFTAKLGPQRSAPIPVIKHAADLQVEADATAAPAR
jgi:hypothetical protein